MKRFIAAIAAIALLGAGMASQPSRSYAQPVAGPVEVVRAFYDALNSRDFDKAHALLQDGMEFMFDAGNPDLELIQTLDDQIPGIVDHDAHFTILSIKQTGAGTVELDTQIDATDLAELNLAHPYTSHDMATVRDGKIVAYSGTTSDQSKADLIAAGVISAPGMPTTGESYLPPYVALMALALITVAGGVTLRRAHSLAR